MSKGDLSGSTHAADHHWVDIQSARAQVEAARLRQPRLAASGQSRRAVSDHVPSRFPPGYRLMRELHRGGQGVVYLALQESTGREVAIKLLHRTLPPDAEVSQLARFEREIEILSRLKHPNIVTIHDCGRDQDHVYLVMDYVEGRRLDAYVAGVAASLRETLALLATICEAVHAAHLRGVIHRDLKPANILVDQQGQPHVLDFGLAKLVSEAGSSADAQAMTTTGQFVGSLPWASPEQAEGRLDQLDIRTDVYSLGVVFYQLLTGSFPYPVSGRVAEVVAHIAMTNPTRPAAIHREIDHELETILLKSLAKEPDRRYQGAGELARDLRRYLAGEPIEARRDSLVYVLRKQLARHRVATVAGATVVLAVTGALVLSLTFWRQAEHQRQLAQQGATAARAAAQRADEEAAQARAVTEFMREVLTSVDPENLGADVRLVDVLANASAAASQRFAEHPLQEARVRELLGGVYDRLSLWNEAGVQFVKAAALWRQHADPDDRRALDAELHYAGELINTARIGEAEQALSTLVPRFERVLGPDDPLTLNARRAVAVTHMFRGRLDEAEPILLALRRNPRLVDDDATQIKILYSLVGVALRRSSNREQAEKRALLVGAEPLARESLERSRRHFGSDSLFALSDELRLANIHVDLGEYSAAAECGRAILANPRLGECHHVRCEAYDVLADALAGLGADQEAADLLLRELSCLRQKLPAGHINLLANLSELMRFLERAGRAREGEELARELTAGLGEYGGGHGDMLLVAELYAAHFVSMQERLDEARSLFESLLAREPNIAGARVRARLHLFYGSHLARCGLYPEAERELQAAAGLLEDIRQGTLNEYPDDVILGFIRLYRDWKQPEKAAEFERLRGEVQAAVAGHPDR